MNFKYLFGALALPALVASCTNEEIILDNNNVQLEGRRVVGNVVLDASKAFEGTDSRWAGAGFVAGEDVIGACLMDAPSGSLFVPTDYISTNYKFSYNEEGQWVSDALFVEGSYYFYMQYNEEMRNRAGLVDKIPSIQYVGESGNDAVLANQLFLGHFDITTEHKDLTVPVQLHEVYARPKFNFAYEGTNGVTIEKVVFSNPAFILDRKLNSTTSLSINYAPYSGAANVSGTSDVYFDAYQAAIAAGKVANTTDLKSIVPVMMAADGSTQGTITLIPAQETASISGAILIPATTYNGDLTMKIYTNKGIVDASIPAFVSTERPVKPYVTVSPVNPIDYVKVDATKMPQTLYGGFGGSLYPISVSFKDNAITTPNALDINTIEELEKYLTNWYTGKKTTVPALQINLGADITLNANVAAFLANTTTNPVVTFAGNKTITIPSGLAATVLNTINTNNVKVAIAEGAEQTLNAAVNKTFANIINNGTLTIAGDGSNLTSEVYTITNMYNNGTLTVDYSSAIGLVWNMGTMTVNKALANTQIQNGIKNEGSIAGYDYNNDAKAIVKANVKQINNYGDVEFEGTIATTLYNLNANVTPSALEATYVYGNAVVKSGELKVSAGYNSGIIDVTGGNMSLTGAFENKAGLADTYNAGLINIAAGKIFSANAVMTNNGDIDNAGYFAAAAGGQILNNGYLNHGVDALTLISNHNSTGKIVLNEPNPAKLTVLNTISGEIEYTTVESDFDEENQINVLDARITHLIVTKTGEVRLKYLGAKVTDMTINSSSASIRFKTGTSLTNMTIKGGEHTISSVTVTGKLTIDAGEVVTIPEGSTLNCSGAKTATHIITNNGSIFVIGTLNAASYGAVNVAGTNGVQTIYNNGGNITW